MVTSLDPAIFQSTPNLRYVHLKNNKLTHLDSNLFQSARNSLLEIDLFGNSLVSINSNLFNGLSHLTYLNLGTNQINVFERLAFRTLANLHEIYLNDNKILTVDGSLFLGLTDLEIIDLRNNPVSQYFPDTLDVLCSGNPKCAVVKF